MSASAVGLFLTALIGAAVAETAAAFDTAARYAVAGLPVVPVLVFGALAGLLVLIGLVLWTNALRSRHGPDPRAAHAAGDPVPAANDTMQPSTPKAA